MMTNAILASAVRGRDTDGVDRARSSVRTVFAIPSPSDGIGGGGLGAITICLLTAGCGNPTTTSTVTGSSPPPTTPGAVAAPGVPGAPALACDPAVPGAACKLQRVRTCKDGDPTRVGEWRYAIAAPLYSAVEEITTGRFEAMWNGTDSVKLAASDETRAALGTIYGATTLPSVADPPAIDDAHWVVMPAHELTPHWKTVSVDGKHPLDRAPGPLAVPLCGADPKLAVRNIDPARLTTLAMTGTTALTRYTSKLMEEKGILYPLMALESWFKANDLVHISNEVSFIPDAQCQTGDGRPTMKFCSKDSYIELLERSNAKIIELTGSHLDDFGTKWIHHSVEMYQKRGWVWFGGGRDEHEASEPRVVEHNGNKLVFLGCNMFHTTNAWIMDQPGVAACDQQRIAYQVSDFNRRGYTVIVSVQHEEVYKHVPPANLVSDLREIAQSGPAFVMGSQAHCPHPWEMHHGAYVAYGPGNLYFDQFWHPVRDSAQNKLYIHAGKLLTVGHLYTRMEERGRPRILSDDERTEFLADMAKAQTQLPAGAQPRAQPIVTPESRDRPDSFLVKGVMHHVTVRHPAKLEPNQKYAVIVELGGPTNPAPDDAFVVTYSGTTRENAAIPTADRLVEEITALMTARYAIDPARVSFNGLDVAKAKADKPINAGKAGKPKP